MDAAGLILLRKRNPYTNIVIRHGEANNLQNLLPLSLSEGIGERWPACASLS